MSVFQQRAEHATLRWSFGNASFDEATLRLAIGGRPVDLERRPTELLSLLLNHAGVLVTKDEIIETVWAGRSISDAALTQCVARLRRALGEDARDAITTVHGYGYRFDAPVRAEVAAATGETIALQPGDSVAGRAAWTLVRRLGEGGIAEVWLAAGPDGQHRAFKFARVAGGVRALKREVALGQVLQQALGRRPDILPLLDWNLRDPPVHIELPYVPAGNLKAWLASQGAADAVPLALRLQLIAAVAEVLGAAHAAGVLHQDVKPGNVLIAVAEGRPHAVLTDFGSGQKLDQAQVSVSEPSEDDPAHAIASGTTLLYQAPELAAGRPSGTGADIFALGVMLFQIIIGDFTRSLAPGWEDMVADPLLREDIALAAAGDVARRLSSAAELALRLRTLDQRRATLADAAAMRRRAEQDRVAVERTRARRAPVAALAIALVAGLTASTTLYLRADHAGRRSARDAARAEAVTGFLIEDLFSATNPVLGGNPNAPIRSVLDAAAAQIDRRFPAHDTPDRASIETAIGGAYAGLAEPDHAMPLLQGALADFSALFGSGSAQAQHVRLIMADLAERTIDYPTMVRLGKDVLASNPADASTELRGRFAVQLASWMADDNDARAVAELRIFLAEVQRRLGPDDPLALRVQDVLAYQLSQGQHFDEALRIARHTVAASLTLYGPDNINVQERRFHLAMVMNEAGQTQDANSILADIYKRLISLSGQQTELSNRVATQLGRSDAALGRTDAAIQLLEQALAYNLKTHGETFIFSRDGMNLLAKTLAAGGRAADAVPLGERAFALQRAAQGADNEDTIWMEGNLGDEYRAAGRLDQAAATFADVLTHCHRAFTHGEWDTGYFSLKLGQVLIAEGKNAHAVLSDSVGILTAALGPKDPRTLQARTLLAASR